MGEQSKDSEIAGPLSPSFTESVKTVKAELINKTSYNAPKVVFSQTSMFFIMLYSLSVRCILLFFLIQHISLKKNKENVLQNYCCHYFQKKQKILLDVNKLISEKNDGAPSVLIQKEKLPVFTAKGMWHLAQILKQFILNGTLHRNWARDIF